jgi:hypothetical protein
MELRKIRLSQFNVASCTTLVGRLLKKLDGELLKRQETKTCWRSDVGTQKEGGKVVKRLRYTRLPSLRRRFTKCDVVFAFQIMLQQVGMAVFINGVSANAVK